MSLGRNPKTVSPIKTTDAPQKRGEAMSKRPRHRFIVNYSAKTLTLYFKVKMLATNIRLTICKVDMY